MKLLPTPAGPTRRTCSYLSRNSSENTASSRRRSRVIDADQSKSSRRQVSSKPALCSRSSVRRWARLRSPKSGPLPAARAWNSSWSSCPTGGGRTQRVPHGSGECNRPTPGELGPTLSKECGATCCPGCRKTRTPVRWYCWADCKRLNRIVSAPGSPADAATQSAAVARHHGQKAGLRHCR